jgi:pilus assembly protein FimV
MHIGWAQLLVAVAALVSGNVASALGFGPIRSTVVLGQPLNLAIPVNLADGELLESACASAEVTAGDARVPPGNVRVRVTQGRDASESVLRISTSSVVEEPVLTVTVSAGCPTRLSRTVVLLADPPLVSTAAAPAAPQALPSLVPPTSAAPSSAQPMADPAPRATRPAPPTRATRTASSQAPTRAQVAGAASAPARTAAPPAPRPVARAEPKSRLQLDDGQVSLNQAAVLAAQEQASAARASASAAQAAASAADQRVLAMEAEMARVRAEAKAQTDALLQLRQQLELDRAQRDQPSPWTMLLIGVVAVLAALAAWLGWRLRKQPLAPRNEADWWDRGVVSTSMADSSLADSQHALLSASQRLQSAPAPWSDSVDSRDHSVDVLIAPTTVPAPPAVTIPPPPPTTTTAARDEEEASRAMSVDEQIDLEQQADFFIALGHDDAAIDLLMAHMRSTGGSSPLPFLKLLEIHRRRDQREAYERTRIRFNQRFNSVAPEWQGDPKAGRTLDDYPLALGRIQRAWPAPLDAMAEIEALLFRRGSEAELFDLPAYQEVLFLFQVARDLHQAEGAGAADVDVLLPIGGRSAPVAVGEGTIVLRPEFNDGEPLALDLDLTTDHGSHLAVETAEPVAEPVAEPKFTLEPVDDLRPAAPDDFWGNNPDARPTR